MLKFLHLGKSARLFNVTQGSQAVASPFKVEIPMTLKRLSRNLSYDPPVEPVQNVSGQSPGFCLAVARVHVPMRHILLTILTHSHIRKSEESTTGCPGATV